MKWCSGPCGRELPPEAFYPNKHGNPGSLCLVCYRWSKRTAARRRYRARHEVIRARRRAYYWREHERSLQARRDYYWRKKVAA